MVLIHASDLHLGRPLRAMALIPTLDREAFRHCAFRSLARLVDLTLLEQAELLVIAGDLIEESVRDYKVGLRLVAELSRLEDSGTRVVWVRGNHDAQNRVIGNLMLPAHVHELGLSDVQTLELPNLGVRVVGRSYTRRACYEDLLASYPPKSDGLCTVGLLHTSGDGAITGDRYAPCRRSELVSKGYDYLALGHVHQSTVISHRVPVAYSGCLQGRSFLESGPRGCLVVRFTEGRAVNLEHRSLEAVRFGVVPVDVTESRTFEDVLAAILLAAQRVSLSHPSRATVARFRIHGERAAEHLLGTSETFRERALASLMQKLPARLAPDGIWLDPGHSETGLLELAPGTLPRQDIE